MKLSICIPTYNRVEYLIKNLEVIVAQIKSDARGDVEIVISDNGSTDETSKRVAEVIAKYPEVKMRLLSQETNLGFDRNLLAVVDAAVGEYCWLLGDDDTPYPGAITKIKKLFVENPECVHFHLNYSRFDKSQNKVTAERMIALYQSKSFKDASEFYFHPLKGKSYFNLLGTNVITMSSNAFQRKAWNEALDGMEKFIRHNMIHVFVFIKMAAKTPRIYFLAEPILEYLSMNHRVWSNDIWSEYKQYVYGYMEELGYSKKFLDKIRKLEIARTHVFLQLKVLLNKMLRRNK